MMKYIYLILSILLLSSCSSKDPITDEKVLIDPNPEKRAAEYRDKGGGILGDINKIGKSSNTFDFASSNVMWKATLKTLDFLPLSNTDYSGGIIVYDWYSQTNNPREQIKISVRFLSNELKTDSIKVYEEGGGYMLLLSIYLPKTQYMHTIGLSGAFKL